MIYTVTFNPSLDYIVSVDDFKLGLTNRTSSRTDASGRKRNQCFHSSDEIWELRIQHLDLQQDLSEKKLFADYRKWV